MKNIFLFCIAVLFLFSCNGIRERKDKSDLTTLQIGGKVKCIIEYNYNAKDSLGQVVKSKFYSTKILKFDKRGNYLEQIIKNQKDSVTSFHLYRYDTNEDLLNDSFNIHAKRFWTIYLYNNKGHLIGENAYYSDNGKAKLGITEINKLDEKGNKIEEDEYGGNKDTLHYKACIKNDEHGQELEKSYFDDKGNLFKKIERVYDKGGNQIDYKLYRHDTLKTETIYKYDNKGDIIEWVNYKRNGELVEKWTYKYNNDGILIECVGIESDSSSFHNRTLHFENFDKDGNWLKWVDIKDGKPVMIKERTIEYYQ